ncbi:MAG: flavodoxin-dependent (E)-4-hydroxy-3-methylbut-2-enyl-diphosphate synthase, partial [Candidatus Aegiribacteria sp.]|nr:flavodoxin-dependent (E)-4-hydroxy-3-methylbut-2-enyl-diphosphate synthase [Candidatus Aegiribacteria sp.]MBD3293919.1 flavodoxin-dependent (E)-4-hydroxy-3-methylbut-2-enyl-diphosphate synthase [Candidatus Fermentibacteria bacterium]
MHIPCPCSVYVLPPEGTARLIAKRSETRKVKAGSVAIGGDAPVSVQSMTNISTKDTPAVLDQILKLAENGAEIVRLAVPDPESASSLEPLVERSPVPLVADIHFDPGLALMALKAGVDKLRLNPGNIRSREDVRRIAEKAAEKNVPIRIGVNSGSLPADLRDRYGGVNRDSMWAAAERHIKILGETGFRDIVLSLKSSDPMLTVKANRKASSECDLPIHLGVTEAGPPLTGSVRSAVAMSILISEGIGNTLRVSLSGSPLKEPVVGWEILSSLNIRRRFPRIVSCPTCARSRIDVAGLAEEVQGLLAGVEGNITVAVMGCEVNGPGEAREAE